MTTNGFLIAIKGNWRDVLSALIFLVLTSIITDWFLSFTRDGEATWLTNTVVLMQGFMRFATANVCAWLFGVCLAWPTLNKFMPKFSSHFESCSAAIKCSVFAAVACAELVAASICFIS